MSLACSDIYTVSGPRSKNPSFQRLHQLIDIVVARLHANGINGCSLPLSGNLIDRRAGFDSKPNNCHTFIQSSRSTYELISSSIN
jgi:hypothetical protein